MPQVKTAEVRFSYCHIFVPRANKSGKMKYSLCVLVPKTNTQEIARYEAAIKAAFQEGVAKGLFTANQWSIIKKPLRDGDKELETGLRKGDEWKGMMFFNANSDDAPGVTKAHDGKAVMVTDQTEVYSGCYGRLVAGFYPYNTEGSRGIAIGLNGVYKSRDGDRLDGRVNVVSAFSEFAEADGNTPEPDANSGAAFE